MPITKKESIKIRKKSLKNGNISLYLDIYHDRKRSYEFLKLFLVPETNRARSQIRKYSSLQKLSKPSESLNCRITNSDSRMILLRKPYSSIITNQCAEKDSEHKVNQTGETGNLAFTIWKSMKRV